VFLSQLYVFLVTTYNYNCTSHCFQLQIRFYNCRNCDQITL